MRKRRTRTHIIADLSKNHFEKQVLLAGFTTEGFINDYGYDLQIFTYNENGEIEGGHILIQLKATDNIKYSSDNTAIELALSKRDIELWLMEIYPFYLILYDAKLDKAYYTHLDDYFKENDIKIRDIKKYKTIFISIENVLTPEAVKEMRNRKNDKIYLK